MRKRAPSFFITFFITLITVFSVTAGASVTGPLMFQGNWEGTGVYYIDGQRAFCPLFEMSYEATEDTLVFSSGKRECETHYEEFDPVRLTYNKEDGGLYFFGQQVGTLEDNLINMGFEAPQSDGRIRVWRMSMRKEGNTLVYEESRIMKGEEDPVISFAGLLQREGTAPSLLMRPLPERPESPEHPGSTHYDYGFTADSFTFSRRKVDVYLPEGLASGERAPVIVFGHGQALGLSNYELSFEHFAQKGVAVIFPQYSSGFFDQNWRRMGEDYNNLVKEALNRYSDVMSSDDVIYSGHSKGAYVALVAAGSPNVSEISPKAMVLFSPAGYDRDYIRNLNLDMPVTVVWGEKDSITDEALNREIFSTLPSKFKQFITVVSYEETNPRLNADHFFTLTRSSPFGGRNGVSPFHYHGSWKWLLGSAFDVKSGKSLQNPFVYGFETQSTGFEGLNHLVERSW